MNRKNRAVNGVCGLSLLFGISASAVPIGVVDSGTDLKHPMLKDHAWVNPGTTPGYTDDKNGWNFAENNNEIIDYSYLGKFSPDTTKYFEVQLRVIEGTATDEDKKWLEEKRKDQAFMKDLMTFANFAHGTHVAGIASRSAVEAHVMAAKIIPTEVKLPGPRFNYQLMSLFDADTDADASNPMDEMMMKLAMGMIADQQSKMLIKVGQYLNSTKMKVANCSFGTGGKQAEMVVKMIGKMMLQRDLTEAEVEKYSKMFMETVLDKGKAFATSSSGTLFVIAAGNDGADNDKMPVFPANLKLENTITVAATRGFDRLASFSNYGLTKVDIAAPGVGILSAIPGEATMVMSGTSQASPFVANVAGKIMDANPNLTLAQVKQILMSTVDKKDFLVGKIVSEGIANEERAVRAAHLSVSLGMDDAIKMAKAEVADVKMSLRKHYWKRVMVTGPDSGNDGQPVEMPSLFKTE